MYSLKVENDRGITLELTNNPKYNVFKIEGLNPPKATINSSVNTTTEIEANVVQANSFYADGSKGLTKSISIATYYTRHTLSFKGGILVGYESEDINNGN